MNKLLFSYLTPTPQDYIVATCDRSGSRSHRNAQKLCALVLTYLLLCSTTIAGAQTQTDFDGDDISDVTYITSTSGTALNWKTVPSTNDGSALNETFGLSSDLISLAHWLESPSPTLGVVRVRSLDNKLVWKILLTDGTIQEEVFGSSSDLVLSGGDFNGNQIDDAVVVRRNKNKLLWGIKRDIFSSPLKTIQKEFGNSGERAFYASPDGERDWLATFGKLGAKKTILRLYDLQSKKTRTNKKIPLRFALNQRPRPLPLKQSDGTDLIVFVEEDQSDTTLTTYSLKGKKISSRTLSGLGTITIGNFLADEEGEEIALHTSAKIRYLNPVTGATGEDTTISGTPIDEFNALAAPATPTPTPTSTPVTTG